MYVPVLEHSIVPVKQFGVFTWKKVSQRILKESGLDMCVFFFFFFSFSLSMVSYLWQGLELTYSMLQFCRLYPPSDTEGTAKTTLPQFTIQCHPVSTKFTLCEGKSKERGTTDSSEQIFFIIPEFMMS